MSSSTPTTPTTKLPLRVISGLGSSESMGGGAPASGERALELDPRVYSRALDCVHCGLCLPACPTYTQNGLEADSPRGRIHLMKGLADGRIDATAQVLEHLDLCLDCRACETACPSNVQYHELIESTRAAFAHHPPAAAKPRTFVDGLIDAMFFKVFPYSLRLKLAVLPARMLQRTGLWKWMTKLSRRLPLRLQKMQQMLPQSGPMWEQALVEHYPASKASLVDGRPRATIGLLAGCVGSVLFQHVNRQTIELLQHAGCDVIVPKAQQCCGAIHHHAGREHEGADFARLNIDAFLPHTTGAQARQEAGDDHAQSLGAGTSNRPGDVDFIVTNIAGCGAQLKDYGLILRDDPAYADRAKLFSSRVRDISQVLVQFPPPMPTHELPITATYHDACHLAHAQKVTAPPRQMLSWIRGLKLIPLVESDMCCGAAGTYNLSQPEMAMQLGERKVNHIQRTGASVCVTGNVGCAMQIQSEAQRLGLELRVVHPVTLLHEACFGKGE